MATVKIFVKNKSDENQQFLIFNDKPAYSESVGAAWINVWGRSPGTGAKHGIADFEIRETFYAICGMSPKELSTDLTVSTSDYEAVQLGTDQVKATQVPLIVDKDGVLFDKQKIAQFKKTGSFGITSGEYDMTQYKHAFCGLGMESPFPDVQDVVPVSVWQAKPNQKYQITPKRTYFISTGTYHAGRIVDFAQLGAYATIDFTGRTETVATVELHNDLGYSTVKYTFDS